MSNNQNLIPLSTEKAREIGKKGGIISGQKRAERKKLKEELEILLEQGNNQERICLSLINKALSGDVRAFETIRETIGENYKDVKVFEDISTRVTIVDDINPFSDLTTEELRELIEENRQEVKISDVK